MRPSEGAILIWGIATYACTREAELDASRLPHVPSISSAVTSNDSTVVIVFDPADCSSCNTEIAEWANLQRLAPERVKILLSRPPSQTEARDMAVRRLRPNGIVPLDAPPSEPTVILFWQRDSVSSVRLHSSQRLFIGLKRFIRLKRTSSPS